jgi:hypothetical protein
MENKNKYNKRMHGTPALATFLMSAFWWNFKEFIPSWWIAIAILILVLHFFTFNLRIWMERKELE